MFGVRAVRVALALTVGILPVVPPDHAHESEQAGYPQAVIHRHFSPHHDEAHDDLHKIFDHPDQAALNFEAVYTTPSATVTIAAPVERIARVDPFLPRAESHPSIEPERLNHGPPRVRAGLRAPPSFSFL